MRIRYCNVIAQVVILLKITQLMKQSVVTPPYTLTTCTVHAHAHVHVLVVLEYKTAHVPYSTHTHVRRGATVL